MDSWAAGAGCLFRRLLTPGVNDWEAADGEEGAGRLEAARAAAATQFRRQRRLWRR